MNYKHGRARLVKAIRWAPDEWDFVMQKADGMGMTPSEFVRRCALWVPAEKARRPEARKRATG